MSVERFFVVAMVQLNGRSRYSKWPSLGLVEDPEVVLNLLYVLFLIHTGFPSSALKDSNRLPIDLPEFSFQGLSGDISREVLNDFQPGNSLKLGTHT